MYAGKKIISICPAGRRQYLEILARYLLREKGNGLIDEHHWWVNTNNRKDRKYIYELCNKYKFFKAVECPIKSNWIFSIYSFFPRYIDNDTIYIRFDDDICYIADDAVEKLLEFRANNPQYFLIFPVIINNQMNVDLFEPIKGAKHFYHDFKIPEVWHNDFLEGKKQWSFEQHEMEFDKRYGINCVSWFGEEFAKFKGRVASDEEQWLTKIKPKSVGKPNAVCGGSVVAHFGYNFHHKYLLESTDIYERYLELAPDWPKSPLLL